MPYARRKIYLWTLLLLVKGAWRFAEVLRVNGVQNCSSRELGKLRGVLANELNWGEILQMYSCTTFCHSPVSSPQFFPRANRAVCRSFGNIIVICFLPNPASPFSRLQDELRKDSGALLYTLSEIRDYLQGMRTAPFPASGLPRVQEASAPLTTRA